MNLNLLSPLFWNDVLTDDIINPFLKRLDPTGDKGFAAMWREHLTSILDQKPSLTAAVVATTAAQPAIKAVIKKKTNYQVFFSMMHPIIKQNEPSISFREISKVVSQKWHELSPDQKATYVDQTAITPPEPLPIVQVVAAPPPVVDFQEEDDAFQILMGGSDVVHDDGSTSGEDSGIEEDEDIEVFEATDNEDDYDDDADDQFDDDDDSKISLTDDP